MKVTGVLSEMVKKRCDHILKKPSTLSLIMQICKKAKNLPINFVL